MLRIGDDECEDGQKEDFSEFMTFIMLVFDDSGMLAGCMVGDLLGLKQRFRGEFVSTNIREMCKKIGSRGAHDWAGLVYSIYWVGKTAQWESGAVGSGRAKLSTI